MSHRNIVRYKSDPLATFTFRAQRGSDPTRFEITRWTAKEKIRSYRGPVVKITALTTTICTANVEINYPCFDRRVQNVSLAPRLPYTEGISSQKPRHNRRCHFQFAIEVRSSHGIRAIYIYIAESGNYIIIDKWSCFRC